MEETALRALAGWANFYVIIGSSAGALTGLQFVVMTLIAEAQVASSMREVSAFGTPTVVHFCAALLVAAIMSAPWHSLSHVAYCLEACGVAGIAYSVRIIWHARKATYVPDTEDWFWYAALPLVTYVALAAATMLLWWHPASFLFVIAAITLMFLFIGIHNAWDTVTYIALQHATKPSSSESDRNRAPQ